MTPVEFEMLAVLTGFLGTGTLLLIGLKMFLSYRAKRFANPENEHLSQLVESVEDLRRDLVDTRAELADVHERVDFTERLLTKARDAGRLDAGP